MIEILFHVTFQGVKLRHVGQFCEELLLSSVIGHLEGYLLEVMLGKSFY